MFIKIFYVEKHSTETYRKITAFIYKLTSIRRKELIQERKIKKSFADDLENPKETLKNTRTNSVK